MLIEGLERALFYQKTINEIVWIGVLQMQKMILLIIFFADETTFINNMIRLYHMRYKSSFPQTFPCTNKYKEKINVWSGISVQGPTNFEVLLYNFNYND